jgi:glutamate decarboxylase
LITDGGDIPVFAWRLRDGLAYDAFDLSERLRERGWQVPAYRMPPSQEDTVVLRIVVRNGFSHDLADLLLADLDAAVADLERRGGSPPGERRTPFAHT